MKPQLSSTRITALVLGLAFGALSISSASAYTVYKLEDRLYAIICADGQIFSYGGGPGGIGIVGEALCDGHGGIVGGSGGNINVVRASRELAREIEDCERSGGQQMKRDVIRCPKSASISKRSARTGRLSE